jgi:hypothetical protein
MMLRKLLFSPKASKGRNCGWLLWELQLSCSKVETLFANTRECVLQSLKLIPLIKFAPEMEFAFSSGDETIIQKRRPPP